MGTEESHVNEGTAVSNTTTTANVVIPKKRRQHRPQPKMKDPESTAEATIATTAPSTAKKPFTAATMADCLACSGCVTTAETVVLEQHTTDVFRQKLAEMSTEDPCSRKTILLMISPASFADILRYFLHKEDLQQQQQQQQERSNTVLLQYQLRFVSLLSDYLGIHHVLDGNVALALSRQLAAQEFCKAYRQARQQQTSNETTACWTNTEQYERDLVPSRAISYTQTQYWIRQPTNNPTTIASNDGGNTVQVVEEDHVPSARNHQALPLVSSSCPAVVCVVEKSKHALVRHLSSVVSPMITTSAVVVTSSSSSHHLATKTPLNDNPVVTIAVMPCHDKKLEASRTDFLQHSVDMVITTRELVDVLSQAVREQQHTLESSEQADEQQKVLDWMKEQILSVTTKPTNSIKIAKHCIVDDITTITTKIQLSDSQNTDDSFFYAPPPSSSSAAASLSSIVISDGQDTATSRTEDPFVLGSGGYADYIFRHAARELFGITRLVVPIWRPVVVTSDTSMKSGGGSIRSRRRAHPKRREYYQSTLCRRSKQQQQPGENDNDLNGNDLYYVAQTDDDEAHGDVVLRFAIAYGMQTAQPLLDDIVAKNINESSSSSSSSSRYHYVEMMACGHGGCLNGGGQIVTQRETPAETRHRVHETQHHFVLSPTSQSAEKSKNQDEFPLYTRYHIVPPMQHAWGAAAGVAVQDTQW
jgi:iron only hydrogenase large subunit-like protein